MSMNRKKDTDLGLQLPRRSAQASGMGGVLMIAASGEKG